MNTTRRAFIQAMAAAPLLGLCPLASASTPYIRYDLASKAGQDMLTIYADTVRTMGGFADASQFGWLWQWYTHFVNGATTKSAELARIFGTDSSTMKSLATETWNTCQSHSGQNANHFLPWHRMFVFYFEQIIRHVSGRSDFTLPYWDYTSDDPAKRAIVPEAFRLPDDPVFGPLYRPARSTLANSGQRIDLNQPTDAMVIDDAMAKTSYTTVGTVTGFCRAIDSGIHGRIHTLVGTGKGMGGVPYAGNDPLFWVHHANIDRMWASWNQNGGSNPSDATKYPWINDAFVFVDGSGARVKKALKYFFSTSTLGYDFDAYISPPLATARAMAAPATAAVHPVEVAAAPSGVDLGARPVRVMLRPATDVRRSSVLGLDDQDSSARAYLVARDLHTWSQPEVLFHLYVSPGRGSERLDAAHYAGNINFFDAEFHDHGGRSAMDMALGDNLYSFDITGILETFRRSHAEEARDALRITIVPGGTPAGGQPMIGRLAVLRQ